MEGGWPYLWIDATYIKVREGARIVPVAVIIPVRLAGGLLLERTTNGPYGDP
jgi:hypothetical protein